MQIIDTLIMALEMFLFKKLEKEESGVFSSNTIGVKRHTLQAKTWLQHEGTETGANN